MSSNRPLYLDIHNHGIRQENCVTSLTPDEYSAGGASGPGYRTVGMHPWHLDESTRERDFSLVREALDHKNVIGVGECGIDRRKGGLPVEEQMEIFRLHVELAEERDLPVIIHAVRGLADIYSVRRTHKRTPWIIHAFFGNEDELKQCLRHDIRVSPGIALLYMMGQTEDHKLLRLLSGLDPDSLYLETDGVRVPIRTIYSIAAERMGMEIEELAVRVERNFRRDFKRIPGLDSEAGL